jgi:hypothetical protein
LQFSLGEIKHIREEMDEPKEINEGARKATEGAVSVFAHLLSRARVIFSSLVFLKVVTKGSSPPFGK